MVWAVSQDEISGTPSRSLQAVPGYYSPSAVTSKLIDGSHYVGSQLRTFCYPVAAPISLAIQPGDARGPVGAVWPTRKLASMQRVWMSEVIKAIILFDNLRFEFAAEMVGLIKAYRIL
ncbi:hypothetical protein SPI_00273 [Niveomyces insectorum RCEF 264]|uniref:Uncharacterized protein n=1 Tax=Niveomyces insectorum RCEF 264 TaxID=1081102 RepID=A0A167ZZT8_9HYPO|nr:hypothetical protein SPI_00273 [Niveomyces insectorum RCEF 264]